MMWCKPCKSNTRRWLVGEPVTHRGAAGDRHTLFGPTLDRSFNAGTQSAVNWRPHVSFLQGEETHIHPSLCHVCTFTQSSVHSVNPSIEWSNHHPSIHQVLCSFSPCRSCSGLCSTSPPPPSRRTDTPHSTVPLGNSPGVSTASCTPLLNPGKKKENGYRWYSKNSFF